ncbi:MAG: hypothetical protein IT423_13515 [Pirellulaceae bacterium]|nr:hypothetical protein [Pirellulaceae bacterium]
MRKPYIHSSTDKSLPHIVRATMPNFMSLSAVMRSAVIMSAVVVLGLLRPVGAAEPVSFRNQIAPLLLENCTSCHGPKKAEGGYRLDSYAQLAKAGDSGIMPLVVEGAAHSELVRRLVTTDAGERMPAERDALSAAAIELFSRWQAEGSKFDGEDPTVPIFELTPARTYAPAPEKYRVPLPVTALGFSPDGSQVLVSGYHELTIWDATTGELKRRISNLPERIHSLDWSADQKTLAVAGGSPSHIGEVRLVDWASGQVTKSFGRAADIVQVVRFQPGGALVATGNTDGTVRWFDMSDLHQVRSVAGHADTVNDIAWSRDGKRLASASRDKTAKVFVVESAELIATYSAHAESVTGICFNDGDKEITSVGADQKAHRWQIEDGKSLAKVAVPGTATRLFLDRTHLWLAVTDRTVRQMELATTKLTRQQDGHAAWVTALAVHPASGHMASGSLDGEVRVWKLDDGALTKSWTAQPN